VLYGLPFKTAIFVSRKSNSVAPHTPASVEVQDSENKSHTLKVEVLGAEETWHSPSLLLATSGAGAASGKIVFSQVSQAIVNG